MTIKAGCNNRPRATSETGYTAQDGWGHYEERGMPVKVPRWKTIKHVMTTECNYTQTTNSENCEGCMHRDKKWTEGP